MGGSRSGCFCTRASRTGVIYCARCQLNAKLYLLHTSHPRSPVPPCRCRVSNKSLDQCSEISNISCGTLHCLRAIVAPEERAAQHRIPQNGLHLPMLLRPKNHQSFPHPESESRSIFEKQQTACTGRCVTYGITLSVESKIFNLRDTNRAYCGLLHLKSHAACKGLQ